MILHGASLVQDDILFSFLSIQIGVILSEPQAIEGSTSPCCDARTSGDVILHGASLFPADILFGFLSIQIGVILSEPQAIEGSTSPCCDARTRGDVILHGASLFQDDFCLVFSVFKLVCVYSVSSHRLWR